MVSIILKKIYNIFIYKYWHYNLCYCYLEEHKNYLFIIICVVAKFPKDIVPIVSDYVDIVEITSTQHYTRLLRIGSQRRKYTKMIEMKQRIKHLCRFDLETKKKNPRPELIGISSILKVESSSKFLRRIDVIISTWIRLSKSMKSRRTFHVEFRRQIDRESTNMCPLGME